MTQETKSIELISMQAAFVQAQIEMKSAAFNCNNPFYKSKYSDLKAIFEACKEALNKNGFFISQPIVCEEEKIYLETNIVYKTGEKLTSRFPITHTADIQKLGGQLTYLRRYSLASLVGLVSDEDQDGNDQVFINAKEINDIETLMVELPVATKESLYKLLSIKSLKEIKRTDLIRVKKWLDANVQKVKEASNG